MKSIILISIAIASLILFSGIDTINKTNNIGKGDIMVPINAQYKKISQSNAKLQMENDKNIILLDVRTKDEYNETHIPNSILIPLDSINNVIQGKIPDKSTKIFVYCRSGRRSEIAVRNMVALGYVNVYDMGGIIEWQYETE